MPLCPHPGPDSLGLRGFCPPDLRSSSDSWRFSHSMRVLVHLNHAAFGWRLGPGLLMPPAWALPWCALTRRYGNSQSNAQPFQIACRLLQDRSLCFRSSGAVVVICFPIRVSCLQLHLPAWRQGPLALAVHGGRCPASGLASYTILALCFHFWHAGRNVADFCPSISS